MKQKCALVIIDMQNDFVLDNSPLKVSGAKKTIPTIKRLLDYFRGKHLDVFHLIREHRECGSDVEINRVETFLSVYKFAVPGTKGCEIIEELKPKDNEYVIAKTRYSCFMNTVLDSILRRREITDLVICGTQYPNCIRATIFDAVSLDYNVINVTDATSSKDEEITKSNIRDIQNIGVKCIPLKEFLEIQSTI